MTPRPDEPADDLPPAEAARVRRRNHDATAIDRKGMRTGLAKQFKQVLDTQVKRGRAAARNADDGETAEDERPAASRPAASQRHGRKLVRPPEGRSRGA